MDASTSLFLSIVFGSFGLAYFVYGKKQRKFLPMLAGIALCAYPYFVSSAYAMVGIGAVLIALPLVIRI